MTKSTFRQCEGHDTKKKADITCLGCGKLLCGYCFNLHIKYFPDCKVANNVQTTQEALKEFGIEV